MTGREGLLVWVALVLGLLLTISRANAHEEAAWIQADARKLGHAWCCGIKDCERYTGSNYQSVEDGYVVDGTFLSSVPGPTRAVYPSEDYETWICRTGGGTPKCFFPPELY